MTASDLQYETVAAEIRVVILRNIKLTSSYPLSADSPISRGRAVSATCAGLSAAITIRSPSAVFVDYGLWLHSVISCRDHRITQVMKNYTH